MVDKHLRSIISWMLVIVIGSSICNIPVLADDANESYLQGSVQDDIQTILDNSFNWIKQKRADDGSFGDNATINDTCYAVEALSLNNYDISDSVQWLSKDISTQNADTLSRKFVATKDDVYVNELVKLQNNDGGFGLNSNYSSDNFDSCLALEALVLFNSDKYNEAIYGVIDYLCKQQNDDGGWGYNSLNSSEPNLTLRIACSVLRFMNNNNITSDVVNNHLDKAKEYLSTVQCNDTSETSFETFMLNSILNLEYNKISDIQESVSEIKKLQMGDGSFYDNIYNTNLVIKYLNGLICSGIKPNIKDFKISTDKSKLYCNKSAKVTGKFSIAYKNTTSQKCKLVTTVSDGGNINFSKEKNIVLSENNTQMSGEAFSFSIIPEKSKPITVKTEIFYNDELIGQYENLLDVIDSTSKADVLIIQNSLPWRSNAAETVLNNLNIEYDKMTAQQAKENDLSIYRMIYVSNDQNTAFYNTMYQIKPKLDSFVSNGGTLVYGVCDSGWAEGISEKIIPGDVMIGEVDYIYNNYIADPTHPIVNAELSDGIPLTNEQLYNKYASHRYFDVSTLPENTKVILTAGENKPTLIEYPIGKGVVIGSTLTWEHSYNNSSNCFGRRAFDDLLLYAYNIVFVDEDINFTSDIYTNKKQYSTNEDVNINLNCGVSAYQCRANGILEVRDKDGNLVEKIADILAVVYKEKPWSGTYKWNTDKYASGDYDVSIKWYSTEDELLYATKSTISILPNGNVTNNVKVDKNTYKPDEDVYVTDVIKNSSTNTFLNNLSLEIQISDVSNSGGVTLSKIFSLSPEVEYQFSDYVLAQKLEPGNYIVNSTVKSGDNALSTSQTSFVVGNYTELSEKYTGKISVSKKSDKEQTLNFSIKNNGDDGQNLTLKALVLDENGQQVGYIEEEKFDLSKKETKAFSELYNTEALPLGNYPVVLVLTTQDGKDIMLDVNGFEINKINEYDVKFVNDDGTVLSVQKIAYGKSAIAPKSPSKENTAQYTYSFSGWDTDFSRVTSDLTVTAVYSAKVNKYTVTFVDDDGTVLDTQEVEYGKAAVAPTSFGKENTEEHTYIFSGWDTDFSLVTSDLTVTAVYSAKVNKYKVTFVDDDGTVLDTQEVEYGKAAVAPTSFGKENTEEHTYTFSGWDTDFSRVTSDLTVTAVYSAEVNKYKVTFVDDDGTVLNTQEVEYGKAAIAPTSFGKENTKEHTYTFSGWDTDFSCVTSDLTVTAVYSAEVNKYKVTFVDDDGTVLNIQEVEYGKAAVAPKDPSKENTPDYIYTFSKWDVDFSCVTSDLTVTAVYDIEKVVKPTEPTNQATESTEPVTAPTETQQKNEPVTQPAETNTQPTAPTSPSTTPASTPTAVNENTVESNGKSLIQTGFNKTNIVILLSVFIVTGCVIRNLNRRKKDRQKSGTGNDSE